MTTLRRRPTSPGEILREEYLKPLAMTQKQLADHIDSDVKVINRIINGRATLTPKMAVKLAAALNTTPEFWLNAQQAVDLWNARKKRMRLPASLLPAS